jgi:DNA-binding NtrC family response regulator
MTSIAPTNTVAACAPFAKDIPSVLVVDDDPLVGQIVRAALPVAEFAVQIAQSASQAIALWEQQRPTVVVLDHVLPDSDGLSLLAKFRERDSTLPIIFITGHSSSQTAIEAMKQGAFDYLSKPLDLGVLEGQVRLAREARRLMRVPVVISAAGDDQPSPGDPLIGRSPGMAEVFKGIGRAAARDMSVLLLGESGTGKALVARAIYQNSARSAGAFRVVSCSDFDSAHLEVELFGSEAPHSAVGMIEQCAGGTLLLEEIGETSPHLQSRLMRLLTTGEFESVGSVQTRTADVRLLVTSSRDLESQVAAGSFRSDLYYHLRSLTLHLPPLRERPRDIPLLIDHFVKQFSHLSQKLNSTPIRVSSDALHLLTSYSWPGNLEQLQSVLRQALIENTGTVLASSSLHQLLQPAQPGELASSDRTTDWRSFVLNRLQASTTSLYTESLVEMERNLLAIVMESTENNQAKSARLLGITRGNLRKKLRSLGLAPPVSPEDLAIKAVSSDEWQEP